MSKSESYTEQPLGGIALHRIVKSVQLMTRMLGMHNYVQSLRWVVEGPNLTKQKVKIEA